jgi:hypothetical protein
MRDHELRAALENYAARRLPVAPDLWPTIRVRAMAYRQLRQVGGMGGQEQVAGSGRDTGIPWRRPRGAAIMNIVATLALLMVVALVLASVPGGMGGRRGSGGGNAIASATPTAVVVPGMPYPVPADCPVSPLRGPEERDGYRAYWLDSNGLAIGIEDGLLYDGVTYAR